MYQILWSMQYICKSASLAKSASKIKTIFRSPKKSVSKVTHLSKLGFYHFMKNCTVTIISISKNAPYSCNQVSMFLSQSAPMPFTNASRLTSQFYTYLELVDKYLTYFKTDTHLISKIKQIETIGKNGAYTLGNCQCWFDFQ